MLTGLLKIEKGYHDNSMLVYMLLKLILILLYFAVAFPLPARTQVLKKEGKRTLLVSHGIKFIHTHDCTLYTRLHGKMKNIYSYIRIIQ